MDDSTIDLIAERVIEKLKPLLAKGSRSEWLTTKEACGHLNISRPTLLRYCDRGLIQSYKIGGRKMYSRDLLDDAVTNSVSTNGSES